MCPTSKKGNAFVLLSVDIIVDFKLRSCSCKVFLGFSIISIYTVLFSDITIISSIKRLTMSALFNFVAFIIV